MVHKLYQLAQTGNHLGIVVYLHKHGNALINQVCGDLSMSPLCIAVYKNHYQTAKTLLKHKANPYIYDKNGYSPLAYAIRKLNNNKMEKLLISHIYPFILYDINQTIPLTIEVYDPSILPIIIQLLVEYQKQRNPTKFNITLCRLNLLPDITIQECRCIYNIEKYFAAKSITSMDHSNLPLANWYYIPSLFFICCLYSVCSIPLLWFESLLLLCYSSNKNPPIGFSFNVIANAVRQPHRFYTNTEALYQNKFCNIVQLGYLSAVMFILWYTPFIVITTNAIYQNPIAVRVWFCIYIILLVNVLILYDGVFVRTQGLNTCMHRWSDGRLHFTPCTNLKKSLNNVVSILSLIIRFFQAISFTMQDTTNLPLVLIILGFLGLDGSALFTVSPYLIWFSFIVLFLWFGLVSMLIFLTIRKKMFIIAQIPNLSTIIYILSSVLYIPLLKFVLFILKCDKSPLVICATHNYNIYLAITWILVVWYFFSCLLVAIFFYDDVSGLQEISFPVIYSIREKYLSTVVVIIDNIYPGVGTVTTVVLVSIVDIIMLSKSRPCSLQVINELKIISNLTVIWSGCISIMASQIEFPNDIIRYCTTCALVFIGLVLCYKHRSSIHDRYGFTQKVHERYNV